jgi:murein DD-endopeptidase MepM/ murein hydrolase activator NlpD
MKKLFFLLFLLLSLANADINTIDKQIKGAKTSQDIANSKIKKEQEDLEKLAKKIKASMRELKKIERKKKILSKEIKALKLKARIKSTDSTYLKKEKKILIDKRSSAELELVDIILNHMVYSNAITQENEVTSEEDIINQAIFKQLNKILNTESIKLKSMYVTYDKGVKKLQDEIFAIENSITLAKSKEKEVNTLIHKQKIIITKLEQEKYVYKKRLQKRQRELKSASSLLSTLKVTKKKAIAKEKKRRAAEAKKRRIAEAKAKKAREAKAAKAKKSKYKKYIAKADKKKIKKIGSSYQGVKRKHFKGRKVAAPLKNCSVTKKFGPYVDPIYDIKIHNDSVTLKPKTSNALVRSILQGKVIFAKEVSLLGKTIIIKHQNDMHSIYSGLSKIAPGIKPGKYVREKAAIGRVQSELKFEVTKADIPINPLEVIKVK